MRRTTDYLLASLPYPLAWTVFDPLAQKSLSQVKTLCAYPERINYHADLFLKLVSMTSEGGHALRPLPLPPCLYRGKKRSPTIFCGAFLLYFLFSACFWHFDPFLCNFSTMF